MDSRYSRQKMFYGIGIEGQQNICQKHVLIVGVGALGSSSAEMLVRSGVGKLTLIDRDYVEWSNLQRQQLYSEKDVIIQLPKVIAAKKRLNEINHEVEIDTYVFEATLEKLEPLIKDVDVIVDGTDNFDIRFLLNDISQKYKIPYIFGACVGSYGSTFTIIPDQTACLHCILEKIPLTGATCDLVGVISPIVHMIASYQVTECLKLLVGDSEALRSTYLAIDLWKNQFISINLKNAKNNNCLSCGVAPTYPFLQYEVNMKTTILCGRDTVQIRPSQHHDLNFDLIEKELKKRGSVERNPFLITCDIKPYRLVLFQDGRALIHGTNDVQQAKALYYSLLG
ncbi:thiamine/molybdopterin biosynthesis protein MoeB [Lysinibacillus sp. PLM2]|nr:thiamine/molybdopterin biosynthesis protein MoeB [Lysinibacillus sp. PLM2]